MHLGTTDLDQFQAILTLLVPGPTLRTTALEMSANYSVYESSCCSLTSITESLRL